MAVQAWQAIVGHLPATSDLSTKQFYGVSLDSSGGWSVTADGGRMDGVLQNKPTAGQAAEVCILGVTKIMFGASINPGTVFVMDSSGRAGTMGSGDQICGVVIENPGAAARLGSVLLKQQVENPHEGIHQ